MVYDEFILNEELFQVVKASSDKHVSKKKNLFVIVGC